MSEEKWTDKERLEWEIDILESYLKSEKRKYMPKTEPYKSRRLAFHKSIEDKIAECKSELDKLHTLSA